MRFVIRRSIPLRSDNDVCNLILCTDAFRRARVLAWSSIRSDFAFRRSPSIVYPSLPMQVAAPVAMNPSQSRKVVVVNHPLVATKLSVLRAKTTAPEEFRRNLNEISLLLAVEAARTWQTERIEVETPLTSLRRRASCAIRRARSDLARRFGNVGSIFQLMPQASVGHIGIYREKKTLRPVNYYYSAAGAHRSRPRPACSIPCSPPVSAPAKPSLF